MKNLNNIPEFRLPSNDSTLAVLIEGLFLKMDQILDAMPPSELPSSSGITKEDAIKFGINMFQTEKAIKMALKDPDRFKTFSRTMSTKINQTLELMKNHKIEVIDHDGEDYYPTMLVDVLVFEKDENIKKPTITETIEPTIYFNSEMVKKGKVIVTQNNNS